MNEKKLIAEFDSEVINIIKYKNMIVACTKNGVFKVESAIMTWKEIWHEIRRKFK